MHISFVWTSWSFTHNTTNAISLSLTDFLSFSTFDLKLKVYHSQLKGMSINFFLRLPTYKWFSLLIWPPKVHFWFRLSSASYCKMSYYRRIRHFEIFQKSIKIWIFELLRLRKPINFVSSSFNSTVTVRQFFKNKIQVKSLTVFSGKLVFCQKMTYFRKIDATDKRDNLQSVCFLWLVSR